MKWYYLSVCIEILIILGAHSQTNITLPTKKGLIIGHRFSPNPATGAHYDAFIGIPYGKIQGRFQLALPRDPWREPLITQSDGPACPQPTGSYNEDCLYLNVFTPVNASAVPGNLSVMAFIHGSGFTGSSSSSQMFGPDFLIPEGVILVAMNYRLGAPGFLTLGSKVAPGNLGLHDTRLALEWVRDEISTFGGNPTKVTLFGQSAGSVMTQFHYISSLSSDLFTKAIAHSGSALAEWGLVSYTEATRRAKMLAQGLGCDTSQNDSSVLSCLQAVDIKSIIAHELIDLPINNIASGNSFCFVPVLDNYETAEKPFFNDTSLNNMMQQAAARAKPLITGFTTEEGIFKFEDNSWKLAQDNLAAFIPQNVQEALGDEEKTSLASDIALYYFPNAIDENKVEDLVRIYTDTMFAYPSIQVSKYFANLTYGYLFAYIGSWAPAPPYFAPYKLQGVRHADDLFYLFYSSLPGWGAQNLENCKVNQGNLNMKTNMVKWWTSFAKTGKPDPSWKTISENGYLVIDSQLSSMNTTMFESRFYNFWAGMKQQSGSSAGSLQLSLVWFFTSSLLMISVIR
uniref:Carboxylic ester hydrolase n=1 Tax=Graphocephala atropunctata TaxID=36148 RepID=A0A1B6M369_9HEMI